MFDKLKQIGEIKKMQQKMKEEKVEINEQGVKIVINGNFEVEEIVLNEELDSAEQARALKNCFNQAMIKLQQQIARSFSGLM